MLQFMQWVDGEVIQYDDDSSDYDYENARFISVTNDLPECSESDLIHWLVHECNPMNARYTGWMLCCSHDESNECMLQRIWWWMNPATNLMIYDVPNTWLFWMEASTELLLQPQTQAKDNGKGGNSG